MDIRAGSASDDELVIRHYKAVWDSYDTPSEHYSKDASARVLGFLKEGRDRFSLKTFIASVDGEVAGSVGCQLHIAPYPTVIDTAFRNFGYIWHVYVQPDFQRRGIGRALTEAAVTYLRDIGCTSVVLNASKAGAPIYRSIGFEDGSEMRLKL